MFNCDFCKKPSEPNTPQIKVVTQVCEKTYTNAHPETREIKVSLGWETVVEKNACISCANDMKEN